MFEKIRFPLTPILVAALLLIPGIALAGGGNPPPPPPAPHTPWYVSIHASEVSYNLATTDAAMAKCVDLGFEGVRTDIFWYDVEPTRDQWDNGKLQFYTNYVSKAGWYGLDPLVILSGAPQWAIDLYNSDKNAFWAEYEEYVEQVVLWVGYGVENYQMWNEANHIPDPIDAGDDWQLFVRAGQIIDQLDPGSKKYVNAMANVLYWEDAVTDWVNLAGDHIDVIGIDHYPATWSPVPATDWTPLDTLIARINNPADAWYGKEGMVMETGYSSWAWLIADEYDQRDWINAAMPVIRTKINNNNVSNPHKIIGGNFYQLIDTCTDAYNPNNCRSNDPIFGQGIEAHFGILHSNLSNKVGYNALKSQLQQF